MRGYSPADPGDNWPTLVLPYAFIGLGAAAVGLFFWSIAYTTYDTWGGVLVGLVLVVISIPLLRAARRREDDHRVRRLLVVAFALKMLGALVRLAVAFGVYDGLADADTYHDAGKLLFQQYRAGNFTSDVGRIVGTGFMKVATGVLYAFTGPTRLGGFLFFTWIGFWGIYFFYRAFCLACPQGDRLRYALLVFLLPSLLFWPSSIGKEAWMMFTLGLASYGAARVLVGARGGFVITIAGLAGTAVVRPHVSAIFVVSLIVAYVLRRPPTGRTVVRPISKLVGITLLGITLVLVLGQVQKVLGVDRFDQQAVVQALNRAQSQTAEGGSVYAVRPSTNLSITRFPGAVVAVLFRPFPWEAKNAQGFIASLEGSAILVLVLVSWRRVVNGIRSSLRQGYVLLSCCYSVLFTYGFSSFSNFGVLTRQRVQVFPFVLLLLALPKNAVTFRRWRELFTVSEELRQRSGADDGGATTGAGDEPGPERFRRRSGGRGSLAGRPGAGPPGASPPRGQPARR